MPERSRELPNPAALDALLEGLMSVRGVKHAAMAVGGPGNGDYWAAARGASDVEGTPMSAETPYYIASIDKLMTATLTLLFHERGELNIDDRLSDYLPSDLTSRLSVWRGQDRSGELTLKHLLQHSSGLANYLEDKPLNGERLISLLVQEGDRSWSLADVARTVREELKPHFPPQPVRAEGNRERRRIRYCDTNYALLQGVIRSVSGEELPAVFRRELFAPLKMSDTWFAGTPPPSAHPPATLFAGDRALKLPRALTSLNGLYSTLADQLRFIRALFNGGIFSSPRTVELMAAEWNRFPLPVDAASLRAPSWPIEYAHGIMRFKLPRLLNGGKAMPELLGHSGSTGTWLFYAPSLDLAFAGTVNQVTAGAAPYRFLPKLLRAVTR